MYVGVNLETKKEYAVKVICKSKLLTPTEQGIYESEVAALSLLREHPNSVHLKAHFEDLQNYYLVLDYAKLGSLRDKLVDYPMGIPERICADIVRQLLNVVAFLHENELMHLDINPSNILLDEGGMVKLCDYGCSISTTMQQNSKNASRQVNNNLFWGKANYIAPDAVISPKCDVWSCGITTYELMTGNSPSMIMRFSSDDSGEEGNNRASVGFPLTIWMNKTVQAKKFCKWLLLENPIHRPAARDALQHSWFS